MIVKKPRHGLYRLPEYAIWKGIRKRCLNPVGTHAHRYIGRGITFCDGIAKFPAFFDLMGSRPTEKHTIDRIDNDGHYSCGQCDQCRSNDWPMNMRWVDNKTNCRNTSKAKQIEFNGEVHCISEWSEITGIHRYTISNRLRSGWSVEKALTTPPDSTGNQPYTLPSGLHEQVVSLYASGMSLPDVGKQVGFNPSAVKKVLIKHGIKLRTQKEQTGMTERPNFHRLTYQGKTQTIAQWTRELGFSSTVITMRLKRGWTVEKALSTPLRKLG